MKKIITLTLVFLILVSVFTGCSQSGESKIQGIDGSVYNRGMEFIAYMDKTPMIGEKEGLDMLNAISPDGSKDSDALYEDVIYVLWVYHNLKSMDSAAKEINKSWNKLGDERTVQEQYKSIKKTILKARKIEDLQNIWNLAGKQQKKYMKIFN